MSLWEQTYRKKQELLEFARGIQARRLPQIMALLRERGLAAVPPDGGSCVLVKLSTADDATFCQRLQQQHSVAVTPGSLFGLPGFVRLAYMNGLDDDVMTGVRLLAQAAASNS